MIINLSDYRKDHECHCSQYLCPRCNPLRTEAYVEAERAARSYRLQELPAAQVTVEVEA